jgi:Ca-activated chloride channel homolog
MTHGRAIGRSDPGGDHGEKGKEGQGKEEDGEEGKEGQSKDLPVLREGDEELRVLMLFCCRQQKGPTSQWGFFPRGRAMRYRTRITGVLAAAFIGLAAATAWTAEPTKYVEIMLDASGSMQALIAGEPKIAIAKKVLAETVLSMKGRDDLAIGVRAYGHQFDKSAKNCQDTKLELPFAAPDAAKVRDLVTRTKAQGQTPIAYSLAEASKDFPSKAGIQKIIILITDGLESCNGDPCAAAKALAAKGVDVKMHVVGFDLKPGELDKLRCLVEPSGGLLLGAKDAAQLKGALDQVVKKEIAENLVVTLVGADGKSIAGFIEAYAANTDKKVEIASAGGAGSGASYEKARMKLPAGTYDLLVQSHVTSEKQWVRGVAVKEDEPTEKVVSFAAGTLSAIAKGTNGAPVPAQITVLRNDGVEDKFVNGGASGAAPAVFSVVPGTYKLKIEQERTKETKIIDGLTLAAEQSIHKEATFAEGSVSVIAKDAAGNPIAALVEVKKSADNAFVRAGYSGASALAISLPPGAYRFVVTNEKTKEAKTIDSVSVADGQAIAKEITF